MFYLTNMLGRPVYDSTGEKLGTVSDLAISTGEVFPRITSLAFNAAWSHAVHDQLAQIRRRFHRRRGSS